MPPLILLEGITRFRDGCVPTKVTGRYPVCDAGHEWRRPPASSGGEVVRRRNSRAPLSDLHGDHEGLRALPASGSTAGARAGASGSAEDDCGRWIGAHAQGPTIAETRAASWDDAGASHARNRAAYLHHGRS